MTVQRYPDLGVLSTDPIDLKLGTDGDLEFAANGDLQFTSGVSGVGQSATIALLVARDELFFNQDIGPPWFEGPSVTADQAILGGKYDQRAISPAVAEELLAAPGVGKILSNSSQFDGRTRKLSIDWSVQCGFDDIEGAPPTVEGTTAVVG